MKKTLLFAILALSITAFAQSKQPSFIMQDPTLKSIENVQGRPENGKRKTSNFHSEMNLGQVIKQQASGPRELVQILDSIYEWKLDTLSMEWQNKDKIIDIVYNANNSWLNIKSAMVQNWNGFTWVKYEQFNSSYDGSNNQINVLYQDWNGSAWVNSAQRTYTYDANNNRTSDLYQYWDGIAWVNNEQSTWTYDASNNLISSTNQYWNGGVLESSGQETYTYDANNNRISELDQSLNGSTWVNSHQYTWTYDARNNQTNELYQYWIGGAWANSQYNTWTYNANNSLASGLYQDWNGSVWVNDQQQTCTYNANNSLASGLYQDWNGSAWVNNRLYTCTYDANNNRTNGLYQDWNGSAWVNSIQSVASYDANNFIKGGSTKYWNTAGTDIREGDSMYFYFHTALGMNEMKVQEGSITIYPNPSKGKFTISSDNPISSTGIYNLLGEPVCSDIRFNQQTSKEIDLSNSPKGIYFIKLYSGTKIDCRKIIIQ